jgi:tetratricopeptide (TPR) repeat protein
VADKKDESHHVYSKMIYQKEIYKSQLKYEPWSFDLALSEATAAYDIQPLPIYRRQQALVLFSQKKFQESSDIYKELINGPLRSADTFFEAASCREMLRDTLGQLALLDSAVATFSRPYLKEAAPYLLTRAQARIGAQKYRDAVADLNDYESLMKAQVNEHFYFLRFQAAVGGRIFQQALNDINKAIELQPQNDLFYAEKASFLVRVGMYDEAAQTASQLIELVPNQSDGYLFLGLAQCLQNKKQEGMKNLQKAKEMGDPQADELIEKYSR